MTMMKEGKQPALSIILCSRNDEYMGNSRWRLETTLNYTAQQIEALGRTDDVEVLVADWNSDVPLREVLHLTPAAKALVSFISIPPGVARPLQQDSSFAEVFALNAAARRAKGEYIGRIDQDTLVGRRFLEVFFQLYEGERRLAVPLERALLYSNRRAIPYWFAVRSPDLQYVAKFVQLFGSRCKIAKSKKPTAEFWTYFVGIWLVHSDIWEGCGGYDERYIYYNYQEVEMIARLRQRYTLIDLGELVGRDFYHLDHQNPRAFKTREEMEHRFNWFDRRKLDPGALPLPFHPNGNDWGLTEFDLEVTPGSGPLPPQGGRFDNLVFGALVARVGMQLWLDKIWRAYRFLVRTVNLGIHRARKVSAALRDERPSEWPRVMKDLWSKRAANVARGAR